MEVYRLRTILVAVTTKSTMLLAWRFLGLQQNLKGIWVNCGLLGSKRADNFGV